MASRDSLEVRSLMAKGVVAQVASVAAAVGVRLQFVGTTAAPAVVMTTATKLALGTVDYAFATYTTMGALVDAINASGIWAARLLDVSAATSTGSSAFKQNTTVAASADGYYDLTIDGETALQVSALITPNRLPVGGMFSGHRVHLQTVDTTQTFSGGALVITIIERDVATHAETTLATFAGAASTQAKALSFASGVGKITSGDGKEILVKTSGGTGLSVALLTAVGIAE